MSGGVGRALAAVALALALLGTTACSAPSGAGQAGDPSGGAPVAGAGSPGASDAASGIRLLGPDEPYPIDGDPVAVVVEVLDGGVPVAGIPVTFTVESGPAAFPAGFEAAMTDETGIAVATTLEATGPGDVAIRVTNGDRTAVVTVTLIS